MRRLNSKDILRLTEPGELLWFQVVVDETEFSFFRRRNRVCKVVYCANIPEQTWIVETTKTNLCKLLRWYRHYRHLGPR